MLKQLFLKFIILLVPEFLSHEKNSASLFFKSVHLLFLFTAFRPTNITGTRGFCI